MTTSSRSRDGAGHPRGTRPPDRRLRPALLAGAAVVVAALVATLVVVLAGRADTSGAAPTDATGCAAMTLPVRYQINPETRSGLFSTTDGAAAAATEAGYARDLGVLFRVAARPAAGLVGVHQLRRGAGDQLWTTVEAEVREATRTGGYTDQGVVAYVSPVPAPCTVAVERFAWRGLHRYGTTKGQKDALLGAGWTSEGSFYAAAPPADARRSTTPSAVAPPTPPAAGPEGPRTVIDARFDDVASGPVSPDSFSRALGAINSDVAAYDSMTYARQADGSTSRYVRTRLAAGRILGRNKARGDGNVLVVPLVDQGQDSACISYDVRFSRGFEVSAGGKLPGLLGVAPGVPPSTPSGGGSTAHGWSGRVMWRGPKLSKMVRDTGLPDLGVTYLYHPGQGSRFGDDISWGRGFVDGGWHQLRQCYTLNTLDRSDGRLQAWVDGDQVLDRADIVYRTDPKVHITHLDWSVFRGGDSAAWAADRDGTVDIDNLLVTVG